MKKSESFKLFLARKLWRDCESVLFEKKWAEIVKNHMENFFPEKFLRLAKSSVTYFVI